MSHNELKIGTVRKINIPDGLSDLDQIQWLSTNGYIDDLILEFDDDGVSGESNSYSFYIDNRGCLTSFWSDRVSHINDEFWKLENIITGDAGSGIAHASKNEDGSYSFVCLWYNGGACFEEVLEVALVEADR